MRGDGGERARQGVVEGGRRLALRSPRAVRARARLRGGVAVRPQRGRKRRGRRVRGGRGGVVVVGKGGELGGERAPQGRARAVPEAIEEGHAGKIVLIHRLTDPGPSLTRPPGHGALRRCHRATRDYTTSRSQRRRNVSSFVNRATRRGSRRHAARDGGVDAVARRRRRRRRRFESRGVQLPRRGVLPSRRGRARREPRRRQILRARSRLALPREPSRGRRAPTPRLARASRRRAS